MQAAAQLPRLSLECVHAADVLVQEFAAEIAAEALLATEGMVPCTDQVNVLLEGARGTLPNGGEKISTKLFTLLSEEADITSSQRRAAQEVLAPAVAAGQGVDVFGSRSSKQAAAAETIVCTNCLTALAANRYAPHLERCMLGKGRQASRNARDAMRANVDG